MKRLNAGCFGLIAGALIACSPSPNDGPPATPTAAAGDELARDDFVLMPVDNDPTIAFSVSFAVGSIDDPVGKEGLAYLTGQMLAEAATEQDSLESILEKLYPIASGYEIRVDRETSTLTGRTHRDNVDRFVELFTNAYTSPAFIDSDFERIKRDTINYLSNTLRYSSDEELGKAALYQFIFSGTRYAHPPQGHIASLESITLDDVREFYRRHFHGDNMTAALGGGFAEELIGKIKRPRNNAISNARPTIAPAVIRGRHVVLVDKPGADASISFGFPIDVRRGERDFYALWIANSWLGEHRNQASHLFQVIRELRGLNYGDYSYIEAFPEGGARTMPPVNVARNHQIFEVWIRTLPNDQAIFALRAAIRELASLVDNGMTQDQFELTRTFLKKYVLQFADTTAARLGYAVDDRFYGIGGDGHLARFAAMMDELTLEEVIYSIRQHLQYDNLKIAIITGDAAGLQATLSTDASTPISYPTAKTDDVMAEDAEISSFPLDIAEEDIMVWPIDAMFAGD